MAIVRQVRLGNSDDYQRKYFYTTTILLCIILSLVFCLITTFIIISDNIESNCSQNKEVLLPEKIITSTTDMSTLEALNIVNRTEWGALPPTNMSSSLINPVPYVIILQTATRTCNEEKSCANIVRIIQKGHMVTRKWWDIGYNFLIGGDGNIYEGRGWKREGAFIYGYNNKAVGIAFIGNFKKQLPPQESLNAAKKLIKMGVENEYIEEDYKLYGQKLFDNLNSDDMLYEHIKNWTHWTSKIE